MPRSERRRWWLERRRPGYYYSHSYGGKDDGWEPPDPRLVALWRLVQWQRIRLARATRESCVSDGERSWLDTHGLPGESWLDCASRISDHRDVLLAECAGLELALDRVAHDDRDHDDPDYTDDGLDYAEPAKRGPGDDIPF